MPMDWPIGILGHTLLLLSGSRHYLQIHKKQAHGVYILTRQPTLLSPLAWTVQAQWGLLICSDFVFETESCYVAQTVHTHGNPPASTCSAGKSF